VVHFGRGAITLALATGLVYAGKQTETTVLEVDKVAGSLWGVLLVVFLAGILTRWATARAAFVALLVGICMNATLRGFSTTARPRRSGSVSPGSAFPAWRWRR